MSRGGFDRWEEVGARCETRATRIDATRRSRCLSLNTRQPQKLPTVLTPVEIQALLDAAPGPKAKAAMAVAYGAGLRASEVVNLRAGDIDSARMLLRVEQGKGQKDRHAMLSPQLL